MIKIKILTCVILLSRMLSGQNSFELEYVKPGNEFLHYTFETSTGDFILVGRQKSSPYPALILKINNTGNIIQQLLFTKPDSLFSLQYGYEKANGNYFLIGTISDTLPTTYFELTNITYTCEMTPQLDLVWEKFYPIPQPYNRHQICNFIRDADSNLYVHGSADSSMEGSNNVLMTMKFDKYGNQLDVNLYGEWHSDSPYNEMIFNSDSTSIYFFSNFTTGMWIYVEFIEMNLDMNIINYINVIDWEHFNFDPITIKHFPNSTFIQANQAEMEPGAYHDLYVKIMDEEFNTLKDTILFYPGYDYIPGYEGMGFIDPDHIWIATFNPLPNHWSGTEVFRFHIFDSNLNLTGMKVYGGDRRYSFNNLLVTSDGGCLLTGNVADYQGSTNDNAYIIKVMPEDIITHTEENPKTNNEYVIVYPNPGNDEIKIKSLEPNLIFVMFNMQGIKVVDEQIGTENRIDTRNLPEGIYLYQILNEKAEIIRSGKWIKN